jgi:tetratricopeptide (TPR) repeat protein
MRCYDAHVDAETAYFCRHAVLRDAAYQLQLPGDRAKLHALAFAVIEQLHGGRAPEPAPLGAAVNTFEAHATDSAAMELAEHAANAESCDAIRLVARKLYLRRAAEYAEGVFQGHNAARAFRELADLLAGAERGFALGRAARALDKVGESTGAEALYLQALESHRQTEERRAEGEILESLAFLFGAVGRVEKAEQYHLRALAIAQETGNRRHEGIVLGGLASLYTELGKSQPAELAHKEAIRVHHDVGNRRFVGLTMSNLALHYLHTDRAALAESTIKDALGIQRDIRSRRDEGIALAMLAAIYSKTDRHELAETTLMLAIKVHREVGNRTSEAECQCGYAMASLALNRSEEAKPNWHVGAARLRDLRATVNLNARIAEMRRACAKAGIEPFDVPGEEAAPRTSD